MIRKLVRTLLTFIFCIGYPLHSKDHPTPPHIQYENELIHTVIPVLEKEFNLECTTEGGSMPYNVSSISISFIAARRANIEEARELQVRCTEKLLKAINENEKIRPYLAEYPFTANRIHISISFETHYGFYSDGTVTYVGQGQNQVHYSRNDPITELLVDLHEEPYSEALKIVQKSTLSNIDLRSHKNKPYENDLDLLMESFAREVRSKWGVKCIRAGGDMVDGIKEFAFLFTRNKRTSVEEARKLEVGINNLLLSKINANEKLRPHLTKYPFPLDQTKIKLIFQESDTEDFDDGSLYSVFQENNKIQYHAHEAEKADAPTAYYPILIKEETYDEALKALDKNNSKKL